MYIVGRKLHMNKKDVTEGAEPQYSVYQETFHDTPESALEVYNHILQNGYNDGFIAKMLTIKTVLVDFDGTELPLTLGANKR